MRHCLVVDDSEVIRNAARRILEELTFEVRLAESARQALELCRRSMPDAVLVDADMAGMNGFAFLRTLRREAGGHKPRALYCTIEHDMERISLAMAAGANEHLLKPFDRDTLETKFAALGLLIR